MTTTSEIVNVPVQHLLAAADERSRRVGSGHLNHHSMLGMSGMQTGALGELVFMEYLDSLQVQYEDQALEYTTHDLLIPSISSKIDVKTKERSLGSPTDSWDCTISDYLSTHQNVDFYAFVSIRSNDNRSNSTDMSRFVSADILGTISRDSFKEKSFFIQKGELDPSNGFKSHKDQWNIKISDLRPPKRARIHI